MKRIAAVTLTVCLAISLSVTVSARSKKDTGLRYMRAISDNEFEKLELLRSGPGAADLFTSAATDTYCIVWYDFEDMDWQGWTRLDNTAQVDSFFHVDDFAGLGGGVKGRLTPLEGTKSMWCGLRDWDHQVPGAPGSFEYLCSWASAPGYGNDWHQTLGWAVFVFKSPLVISYMLRCDTEPDYDYVFFEGDNIQSGQGITELARYDGEVDTTVTDTLYLTTGATKLRFRFVSDGAWSDQDGLWDTDGAVIVDSIAISDADGLIHYEDFESYPVGVSNTQPYGGPWWGGVEEAYGTYSGLADQLEDKDPCDENLSTQIVFFIGSPYPSTEFPGLYDTPFCMGAGNVEPPCQDEMVVSPIIDLTKYSTGCDENQDADIPPGELSGLGGVLLRFTVFDYLPTPNLVFYGWEVRSIDPSGCPGRWDNNQIIYYYRPLGYCFYSRVISSLVTSDSIQVALRCIDMCQHWYQVYGNCAEHTPAPWFDNARLYRYDDRGPFWSYRDLDLFQDNFPGEEFDLESYIRADCANDLRPNNDPVIDPGDSIAVTCYTKEGIDTMPDGSPRVFMHLRCPYIGDPASPKPDLYGPALEGTYGTYYSDDGSEWTVIQGDYARAGAGNIVPDKYMFDLNDSLFTRGYRIDYYFEAYDLTGYRTTLPEHPAEETYFEWTCLPTLASDILYVDDYNRGAPPKGVGQYYYEWSFFHVLPAENQPDRYDVNNPSSAVSNGPGSRAKSYHLQTAYKTIIWDSGNLSECTISEGTWYSDKSNDAQMLIDWLEFSDHRVGLWVCGDDVASDLDWAPSGPGQTLMTSYCGVDLAGHDYNDLSGEVNPLITADVNMGNPLWHTTWGDSFYLSGGCPLINEFDYLEKTGDGEYALRYPDAGGMPYYAGIYGTGVNDGGYPLRTMWFGFSFMYIRDAVLGAPIIRDIVMRDILDWMENDLRDPIPPPAGEDDVPLVTAVSPNYPNPFNPVTTIKFSLKEKGRVSLRIYDVTGRLVRTVIDDARKAGYYEERWDGTNNGGRRVASGVYFYRFETVNYERTRKMVLLR